MAGNYAPNYYGGSGGSSPTADEIATAVIAKYKADAELGTGAGGAANADEVKARVRAGVGGVWEDEDGNRTTLGVTDPV